ncbi:MAG: hypothetical protein K2X87_13375 [Gemmataceae bacterium]|nr:hypothetical protein [Gemmataceae bacterium]
MGKSEQCQLLMLAAFVGWCTGIASPLGAFCLFAFAAAGWWWFKAKEALDTLPEDKRDRARQIGGAVARGLLRKWFGV